MNSNSFFLYENCEFAREWLDYYFLISNGNRTEWSPIRSVIITITKLSNLIGYQLP